MRRILLISIVTIVLGSALAATAFSLVAHGNSNAARAAVESGTSRAALAPEPDTSSPGWKRISDEAGIMLRQDPRLGLRGRLYVRIDGKWQPVALDGPGDIAGVLPAS